MNVIEQNDYQYTKERTEIEAYLTRIIQRFFDIENNNTKESIEAIIVESLTRLKRDFYHLKSLIFHLNGETGHIKVDVSLFDGEKAFEKNTAFNKDFGIDADTVCEGNDIRLSDARIPLDHVHTVADIDLLNLLGGTNIVNSAHNHLNNKALDVIRCTSTVTEIDLIILENILKGIQDWEETIRRDAVAIQSEKDTTFQPLNDFLKEIQDDLQEATNLLASIDKWVDDAKSYADTKASKLDDYLKNLLLVTELSKYTAANDSVFLLTQDVVDMNDMSIFNDVDYTYSSDGIDTKVEYKVTATIPVAVPIGYKVAYVKAVIQSDEIDHYIGINDSGNISNMSRYVQKKEVLPKYYPNPKQNEPFILSYDYTENGKIRFHLDSFVKIPSACKELCKVGNIIAFRTDGIAIQGDIEKSLAYITSYLNVNGLPETDKNTVYQALNAIPEREYEYLIDGQYKRIYGEDGNITDEGWFDNLGNKMTNIDWEVGMYEERPGCYLILNYRNKTESMYVNTVNVERNALISVGPSGINGYIRNPKIIYQVYCRKE